MAIELSEEKIQIIYDAFEKYEDELNKVNSAEEAVALLKSKNVEVSVEDFQQLAAVVGQSGELDENALDAVAGGVKLSNIWKKVWPPKINPRPIGGPIKKPGCGGIIPNLPKNRSK